MNILELASQDFHFESLHLCAKESVVTKIQGTMSDSNKDTCYYPFILL